MSLDDTFEFHCGPELACFGKCCHDVTIVLTPYDVLRLKRATGTESSELLEKHTLRRELRKQKFPVVILKMNEDDKRCPFVSGRVVAFITTVRGPAGYPLGAAEPKSPTPNDCLSFCNPGRSCQGHAEGVPIQVREWMALKARRRTK